MNLNTRIDDKTFQQSICFTGHRPAGLIPEGAPKRNAYQSGHYTVMQEQLKSLLKTCIQKLGITRFITGGAQGFDQLVAMTVQELKQEYPYIENVLYLPFHGQESKWASTGFFGQETYHHLLLQADKIIYCTNLTSQSEYYQIVQALQYRNECMIQDSIYTMSLTSVTETAATGKGGTWNAIRFAHKINRQILDLKYDFNDKNQIVLTNSDILV